MEERKQRVSVQVAGKTYNLVSTDSPEHMRRVAELVDRRVRETELATGLPEDRALALTCLNLADELVKAKDESLEMRRRMQKMMAEKGDRA